MNLAELEHIPPKPVWDGVYARIVEGEHITMSIVELAPDTLVPEHQHHNEQIGMVIAGSIHFRVGDEAREFGPGGTWRILAGIPHEARSGPDGATVVEVFSPIRSDWATIDNEQPRPPSWPAPAV